MQTPDGQEYVLFLTRSPPEKTDLVSHGTADGDQPFARSTLRDRWDGHFPVSHPAAMPSVFSQSGEAALGGPSMIPDNIHLPPVSLELPS